MIKLYINESAYIKEDIEAVKKYYPNIEDGMFMDLIALDPTYRDGSNSVGKYGKWILNLYNKGNLSEDDFNNITDVLNQFTTYRNRIQNKDLNSYKSLSALEDVLATVIDDDSMLTNRQKLRFMKNVKAGRVKISAEDDYDVVLETPNFIVYVPNTHEASMKLGRGTEWCTAHENPEWYKHYTQNGGKLYIVKDKRTDKRWQYSDKNGDFLNEYDEEFDIPKLMLQDEKLSKFFAKFLGIDYFAFDGTWIYDGTDIPVKLITYITKIIVDNNVMRIKEEAFRDCENLTSIKIPNSVTKIGDSAFSNCKSLTSINIPNSVTEIRDWTFRGCKNLTSINIPNSVTEIGDFAFGVCKSLTSINIPNSVTKIGDSAFSNCKSLTSITIPNSVTEIGKYAFSECISLTSIKIPNSVTEIGSRAFGNCESLTSITIPNSVIKIGKYTFEYCTKLKSIHIPNSVTEIGDSAFDGCDNLTVYTNNNYVINYCNENNIPTQPLNSNESYRNFFKLHIKEGNYI